MRHLLDFIASAAIIIWMVEYLGYGARGNVYLLLIAGILLFGARIVLGLVKRGPVK